ncbi:MAG TPA: hypothetical protein DEG28_01090 [Porphyromonadaceae bacterium]|nr:hypothetical protein [Porphyromonadaceae bacterium]
MAEKTIAKLRVVETEFADPIANEAGIATAIWAKQPLTYREDAVEIVQGEPEEEPLYSHENDAPEDVDYAGTGVSATGSFIKATREQMVGLMGGSVVGEGEAAQYAHPASLLTLNKAIRFTCKDGSKVIIPNAKGYVLLNLNIGKGGLGKFPFRFNCQAASPDWKCDILL